MYSDKQHELLLLPNHINHLFCVLNCIVRSNLFQDVESDRLFQTDLATKLTSHI